MVPAGNDRGAGDEGGNDVGGAISVVVSGRSALVVVGGHPGPEQSRRLGDRVALLIDIGMSVTVELGGLQMCTSPLLEALVRTRRRALPEGAELRIPEPGPSTPRHVVNLLALVGVTDFVAPPNR